MVKIKSDNLKSKQFHVLDTSNAITPRRINSKASTKSNRSKSNDSNKSIGSGKLKTKYTVKDSNTTTNNKIISRVSNLENMISEMYQVFKKTDESKQQSHRSEKPSINFDDLQDPRPKSTIKDRNTSIDFKDNNTSIKLKSKFKRGDDELQYRNNKKIDVENNDQYDFTRERESDDEDDKRVTDIINKSLKSKSSKKNLNLKLTKKVSNECNISNISNLSEKDKRYTKMKIEYDNYIKEINSLIKTKNDENDFLKQKLKEVVRENELFANEIKDSRNQIESLQTQVRELDSQKNELYRKEEAEYEQIKVFKDDINSLSVYTQQLKIENAKVKDAKQQKEDYIQVLLTEKQYLHEEIKDLKHEVRNLNMGLNKTGNIKNNVNISTNKITDQQSENTMQTAPGSTGQHNKINLNFATNTLNKNFYDGYMNSTESRGNNRVIHDQIQRNASPGRFNVIEKDPLYNRNLNVDTNHNIPILNINRDRGEFKDTNHYEFRDRREDSSKDRNVISDIRNGIDNNYDKFEREYNRLVKGGMAARE